MVGRRVFVKDRLGNERDRFKVTIKKSDSEESMEDGEICEETRRNVCWDSVVVSDDESGDRRVVETDIGKEPLVRRVSLGNSSEKKRRIGWGDPYDVKAKRSRQFDNFKQNIQSIIIDKPKVNSSKTFIEGGQEHSLGWGKKLKAPKI